MSYDILFRQALSLHESGDLLGAEKIYRQILEAAPENPDILNLLGLIAQSKNIHIEAVQLFYQAIKKAPAHAPFHFNLAISLEAWGKPYEAIDAYYNALKYKPDIAEAYLNLANIYLNLNDKRKAIENFEKTLDVNPTLLEAKTNILFLNAEKEQLEDFKNQYPEEVSTYYFLSKLYQEENLSKATENIEKASELLPNSDLILFQKGYLHLLSKDIFVAKEAFESTIKLNPQHIEALINLANIETNEKNYEKAEQLYKKAIEIDSKNLNAHLNYATLLYLEKKTHQALEEYRQAVIINPEIPETSNNIGLILRDLENYEEALGLFFNAFYKNPQKEEFSLNIIETLYLLSQKDKETATKIAGNWFKSSPENLFAKQANAFLLGDSQIIDTKYNEILFDHFAEKYEKTLESIDYNLINKIKELNINPKGKVLDIGCGSGLLGEAIKMDEIILTGIDLSKNMLLLSKEKNVYDELIQTEALPFLQKKNAFDWFFALDVFNYIGDISEIISLCKGKNLCFSIETVKGSDKNFVLTSSGRFQHNPAYIEKLLQENAFKIVSHPLEIRLENNLPVQGIIYLCS